MLRLSTRLESDYIGRLHQVTIERERFSNPLETNPKYGMLLYQKLYLNQFKRDPFIEWSEKAEVMHILLEIDGKRPSRNHFTSSISSEIIQLDLNHDEKKLNRALIV